MLREHYVGKLLKAEASKMWALRREAEIQSGKQSA